MGAYTVVVVTGALVVVVTLGARGASVDEVTSVGTWGLVVVGVGGVVVGVTAAVRTVVVVGDEMV